jgi:hypothetical protein
MSDEPKRYHVVKHTWTVVHEYPREYDESAEFALTENRCSGNVIDALHEVNEICESLCNVCYGHKAEYIGAFNTMGDAVRNGHPEHSQAIPLSADYWRERMHKYDTGENT